MTNIFSTTKLCAGSQTWKLKSVEVNSVFYFSLRTLKSFIHLLLSKENGKFTCRI